MGPMQTVTVLEIDETSPHLIAVKELWRANKATLGFLPDGAFNEYASKRMILVALNPDGECIGYLLYRLSRMRVIIAHLCVREDQRRRGVARLLFEGLKARTSQCFDIVLNCRRDFAANSIWPQLGFFPIGDRIGRSKQRRFLDRWLYDYGKPTLFSAVSTSKSRAVLDASVLFDLQGPVSKKTEESKALEASWLRESVVLCLTDEIYLEINRHSDRSERDRCRRFARNFTLLPYDHALASELFGRLQVLFPSKFSPARKSDLNQLAKAAAADAHFFLTRDEGILGKADEILESLGIRVMRPCELVVLSDEIIQGVQYRPARLAGSLIQIQRVQRSQIQEIAGLFQNFERREAKKGFAQTLHSALVSPGTHECCLISGTGGHAIGFFILDRSENQVLKMPIIRIRKDPLADTLARHLVWHVVTLAGEEGRLLTVVTDDCISEHIESGLKQVYFVKKTQGWIKINLQVVKDSKGMVVDLANHANSFPVYREDLDKAGELLLLSSPLQDPGIQAEIESLLWPAKITNGVLPNFIVPIKSRWAMHLFDYNIAARTLFGSDPRLALNVENVYYRAPKPKVLHAPSRILWYVSKGRNVSESMHLRACSYLREVEIGLPKEIFRRFHRFGVYEWNDIKKIVNEDLQKPIMGFCFSHTEIFPHPISWSRLQEILNTKGGGRSQIQSPIRISEECFIELYKIGKGMEH